MNDTPLLAGVREAQRVLVRRKAVDDFCGDHRLRTAVRRWLHAIAALRLHEGR
jgi:hypothetical protein